MALCAKILLCFLQHSVVTVVERASPQRKVSPEKWPGVCAHAALDKGVIELIGPYGLTEGSYKSSETIIKLDTGVITTYALYITLGLISLLILLFLP